MRAAPEELLPACTPPPCASGRGPLRWLLALLAAAAAVPASAAAPGGAAAPAPPGGPRYEVTVSREGDVVERIGPRRVIDAGRIRERSARTLDEALAFEPGVYVRNGNEGVPRIDMRGLRSRHVLLLLDGIPFNSSEDGQFDPALLPTESLQAIRLGFGNASVLYGDGPIAGVIQLDTRESSDEPEGSLGFDVRSGPQYLGRFVASGQYETFDLLAAGSLFDRQAFPLADDFDATAIEDGDKRTNSRRERSNLLLRGGWSPTETTRFGALITLFDGEHDVPPNVIDAPADPFAARTRFERVEDEQGGTAQLSAQWDPEGPLELRSWFYLNRREEDRRRYDSPAYDSIADPRVSGTFERDGVSVVSGGALHGRYALGRLGLLKFAAQSRHEEFQSEGVIRDVRLGGGQFGLRAFDETSQLTAWSGGLEWEVEPLPRTGFVIGYSHALLDEEQRKGDDGPIFLAGLHVDPRPGTRLRASLSRKLRFPSLTQLYDVDGGNPELDSESAWDYEIGFRQELPARSALDVTAFWQDVADLIERDEVTRRFENFEEYRFRGVEVTLDTQPLDRLDLRASYAFLDAENRSSDAASDELENRPEQRFSFAGTLRLPGELALRADLEYVADQVVLSRSVPLRSLQTGDYTVVGLRLGRRLLWDHLDVYLGVSNLFEVDYQRSYGVPDAGRVCYAGLDWRL